MTVVHSTTALSIRVDNGSDADAASALYGTTTPDRVAIGCLPRPTPVLRWDGVIGEILVYQGEHDVATRALICAYLSSRWSCGGTINQMQSVRIGHTRTIDP